jgi:predicted helicase
MIDWPRNDVIRHLLQGDNLALIARRQMLPSQPCNYFWITDTIALDGVIRSDNRGSESIFPLYLLEDDASAKGPRANFAPDFIDAVLGALNLDWLRSGRGDLARTIGPEDLFFYCYAVLFSPTFRQRYADLLRSDFPRIPLTPHRALFQALSTRGAALADGHLLRRPPRSTSMRLSVDLALGTAVWSLPAGYPRYAEGAVEICRDLRITDVPHDVWDYHVGGHQVCRKWLRDRRTRELTAHDLQTYCRILGVIADTLDDARHIDRLIEEHGGWPAAFHAV